MEMLCSGWTFIIRSNVEDTSSAIAFTTTIVRITFKCFFFSFLFYVSKKKKNLFVSVFYFFFLLSIFIYICISFVSIPLLISLSLSPLHIIDPVPPFHNKEKKTINLLTRPSSTVNKLFLLLNFYYIFGWWGTVWELTSSFNLNQTSNGSCINVIFLYSQFQFKFFHFSFLLKRNNF